MQTSLDLLSITTINPHISFSTTQSSSALKNARSLTPPTPHFYQELRGTIIPKEWKSLVSPSGKKLSRGALELYSIIVSWYNFKKVINKENGEYKFVPKFDGDELRKNYDYFTKELDRSQEQVRRYFAELKSANLVTMELRTVTHNNWRYHNTLCIKLNKEAPHLMALGASNKSNAQNMNSSTKNTDSLYNSNQNNLQTTSRSLSSAYSGVKKIWPEPCKKVDSTPQKSGASYIDKTTLKTNLKLDLLDLEKSNFIKKDFFEKITQLQNLEQKSNDQDDSESATALSRKITSEQCTLLKEPFSLQRKLLREFYPLLEQDAIELRSTSGRDFSLNYINKLLLKLSREKSEHGFYTKNLFLKYMSVALKNELRQAPIVNNIDFTFAPKIGSSEYDIKHKANYLDKIESSIDISPISQVKRKIVGRFETTEAYSILTSCEFASENQMLINTDSPKEYIIKAASTLTDTQKLLLTQITKEVFGDNTNVIFTTKDYKQHSREYKQHSGDTNYHTSYNTKKSPEAQIPTSFGLLPATNNTNPLWRDARGLLSKYFGEGVDKSWFSKLDLHLDNANNIDTNSTLKVSIKAPTTFVKDYTKTNYGSKIESILQELISSTSEYQNYRIGIEGVGWVC